MIITPAFHLGGATQKVNLQQLGLEVALLLAVVLQRLQQEGSGLLHQAGRHEDLHHRVRVNLSTVTKMEQYIRITGLTTQNRTHFKNDNKELWGGRQQACIQRKTTIDYKATWKYIQGTKELI